MQGTRLSRFDMLETIGEGAAGAVYRARDTHLLRDVAIKVLRRGLLADAEARRRFRREALALSRISHPNVAVLYDFDSRDGVDFLVMELVPGTTLAARIAEGPLGEAEIRALARQAAAGLAAAHQRGIAHRDLKPHNIRVTPDGRLKLLDFGLARALDDDTAGISRTAGEDLVGTLAYMAPEVLEGRGADHRSDLYALGVVLFELATGRRPFAAGPGMAGVYATLHQAAPPLRTLRPDLPPTLEALLARLLERDPARRPASAAAVAEELERGPTRVAAAPAAPEPVRALAVLPLDNLSGDPSQVFFADGLTEALIADLARLGAFRVISRTSVMRYKGTRQTMPEIGRELDVEAILEGSVIRSGPRVRVTVQLIHAARDEHLWGETYERDLDDMLVLQSEIARAVARQVQARLSPQQEDRLARTRAVDPGAYEAYLKGRFHWYRRTEPEVLRGIEYFRQAIERDPGWALPHVGLADAYNILGFYSFFSPADSFVPARAAARRALAMDPALAEAHCSLAYARHYHDWDAPAAEAGYRKSLELHPQLALAHQWYLNLLTACGREEEALAEGMKARQLDPTSLIVNAALAWAHFFGRRYAQALELFQTTADLAREFAPSRLWCGWTLERLGRFDEAIVEIEAAARLVGRAPLALAFLSHAHAGRGEPARARELLDEMIAQGAERYVDGFLVALAWVGLGDPERALDALERAAADRSHWLTFLGVEPRLDPLRGEPRFAELVRRVGMSLPRA